jgi:hypothetical protein
MIRAFDDLQQLGQVVRYSRCQIGALATHVLAPTFSLRAVGETGIQPRFQPDSRDLALDRENNSTLLKRTFGRKHDQLSCKKTPSRQLGYFTFAI